MVWIISADSDCRRLIGLNLGKRGLRTLEIGMRDGLTLDYAQPDLIILDADPSAAPNGPVWEVGSALRRNGRLREVPLILILPTLPTAGQLAPLQPVRWVEKPLSMGSLLALVREGLAPQRAERDATELWCAKRSTEGGDDR